MAAQTAIKLVVIGASSGGLEPITQVLSGLPDSLNAACLVIRHLPRNDPVDRLTPLLNKRTQLNVVQALNGLPLRPGNVYVARANTQVRFRVLNGDGGRDGPIVVEVSDGSEGKRSCPTIDVTLASAAPLFRRNLIAVILSGRLDDGTDGCVELARYKGTTIAQQPLDAAFSSMPLSVINEDSPRYIVDADEIPPLLVKLCGLRRPH